VSNNKVLKLIKIYNFYFGHFFIRICLNNLKLLNLNSKWIYILKKKKVKRKMSLGPTILGLTCLPPPVPPLPFHLGRGPAPSPTLRALSLSRVGIGYIDVAVVIFEKTFSDALLPSHKNSIYRHKFATAT
jgi:hypothetical protein